MDIYDVEAYSSSLPMKLLTSNQIGEVHSIFQNGFNVRFRERLVYFSKKTNTKTPFSIILPNAFIISYFNDIEIGDKVVWINNMKEFVFVYQEASLCIKNSPSFCTYKQNIRFSNEVLFKNLEELRKWLDLYKYQENMFFTINDVISGIIEGKSKNSLHNQFLSAYIYGDLTSYRELLRYYIGRGSGLTPSGDDLIMGLLAVFICIDDTREEQFISCVEDMIKTSPFFTTDISREYLIWVCQGYIGLNITKVIHDLMNNDSAETKRSIENLLEVGHTSGHDTLLGILLGFQIYKRKYT